MTALQSTSIHSTASATLRVLRAASWAIEPLTGTVFTLLWINAESGRGDTGLVGMIGFGLAIALSRRFPFVAFGLLWLTVLLQCFDIGRFGSTDWPAYLGILLVVGFATAHGRIQNVWIPLVLGVSPLIVATALMAFGGWLSWTGVGMTSADAVVGSWAYLATIAIAVCVLFWGSGWGIRALFKLAVAERQRAATQTKLADSEVQLAVAEERNRIAQEMHDVLAHSLAVVVAQADGARYLRTKRPAVVDAALLSIAASARSALVDVGGIIDGVLDGKPAPQPGLDDLEALISTVSSTGLQIDLTQAGEQQPLAPGQQLAVYRIVQEGLTNALRHRGRDSRVSLVLDWRGPGLSLQLVSSGDAGADAGPDTESAADAAAEVRVGRGVTGMMERARLAGGWAAAGPDETGDHWVTAFIPFREGLQRVEPEPVGAAA